MKRILSLIAMLLANPILAQQDAPLPARVAVQKMTLPDGFKATLFAGEPDVVQPIAFCFDDRGRLWVAECLSYPNWEADPKKGKDRVVIFEDTDGDGVHDKRTVFAKGLQNLSGINYGFGGIWLCSTPNLIFIPIKEEKEPAKDQCSPHAPREDVVTRSVTTTMAGPPEILLDGWSLQAKHNVFNSLTWGPDGWLYGCNGIIATSRVGRPGTPDKDRVPMNCGVWRYHPTKKKFEVVAHGTTNPWGLDFDEHGEMFITNCVIDHLWHIVPGGHYERMYGEDLNPHVYKLMPSICDHKHWGGGSWTSSRHPSTLGRAGSVSDRSDGYKVHSEAGGGHAHVGCMIYLGDNWPARYRGGVFMCNLHGSRINHDILERNGSTYVARHAKDFMLANDPWFRGLAIHYGPDGGVYVSDWTDTGECHNYKVADQTNGRIYKITYGNAKPWKGDLAKLDDRELVEQQFSKNHWIGRHARRLLQERAEQRKIAPAALKDVKVVMLDVGIPEKALLAMWTLHAAKELNKNDLVKILRRTSDSEYLRAWALRFLVGDGEVDLDLWRHSIEPPPRKLVLPGMKKMERELDLEDIALLNHTAEDPSPLVRLHLASVSQRLISNKRFTLATWLADRRDDSKDPYLPLMYWYGLQSGGLTGSRSAIPLIREFSARIVAERGGDSFDALISMMNDDDEDPIPVKRDWLRGIQDGLGGRRQIKMPREWKDAYPLLIESPLPEVRERTLALAVQFGDERAFTLLRKIVPDRAQPIKQRENALKTLLFQQKPDLVPILQDLLSDESLRGPAIRGLAAFDDATTPKLLLAGYPKWNADDKSDVIQTLSARPKYALEVLDAIDKNAIPRQDINSYTVRQWQALKSPEVAARLAKVWGEVRPASADKAKLMAKYKAELKPDVLKKANLSNGRALYTKSCAACHRLFGEGSDIGPDITGSQRTNLDYVLENILDPSAIVPREYQVTVIETKNGRTLSGIVKKESDTAITLRLQNEEVVVPKSEIASRTPTTVSMMPEGAFDQMRLEDVRDLVAYLASPVQVALKK